MVSDPAATLMDAVHANDSSRVAELLARHPELKSRLNTPLPGSDFGAPAITCAVEHGNRELIQILLQAGADINARSDWWAGSFGVLDTAQPDLVPFLLERGARLDAHSAARLGRLDDLRRFVATDPKVVRARGGDGQSPLHFASTVEVARFLLDHGADINALDVDHESTPAQWMMESRHDVVRFLVTRGCRTDILMAAGLGDLDLVRQFLDADPASLRTCVFDTWFPMRDPRAGGSIYRWTLGWMKTAHQVARGFGHEDVFQFLMDRSPADLRLVVACELDDEAAVRQLLAAQPDLAQSLSDLDRRRLSEAANGNRTGVVKLMLSAGWPPSAPGQFGGTALHWAAWHGNAAMVREILRYHPEVQSRSNDWSSTPLEWAGHGADNSWHRATGDYRAVTESLVQAGGGTSGGVKS